MSAERVFILLKAYAATRSLSNFDLVEQLCEHVWADLEVGSPEELLLGELLNRFETLVGIERDEDGAIKSSAPGPMLPEPVECGVPCASCEALAHVAAQFKSEKDRQAREIVRLMGELEESKAEGSRLGAALNNVQDERAASFARLGKAVGGTSLTEYQPEIDLEIEAAVNALVKDKERLDWLDRANRALNEKHGTKYGWKYDANHNRCQIALTDCNVPALSIRQAIDAALAGEGKL